MLLSIFDILKEDASWWNKIPKSPVLGGRGNGKAYVGLLHNLAYFYQLTPSQIYSILKRRNENDKF